MNFSCVNLLKYCRRGQDMHNCEQIDVGNFLGCLAKMLHLCHLHLQIQMV